MKKLFLASFASVSLELIAPLLSKKPQDMTVAFIPTAGDPYDNKDFVYVDRDALIKMGFNVITIDIATTQGAELETALKGVDAILVAGGNTFYLLEKARQSGFDVMVKKLIDKGVLYIGSSAGSILCCPTIEGAMKFDDPADAPTLKNYQGLGLVDFVMIPHAHKEKYFERITQTTRDLEAKNFEVIALTDDQVVVVNGTTHTVVTKPAS